MFNKFPYTDFHEMNLDYIINKVQELIKEVKDFKITGEIHYHDPIEWNPTTFYTRNTIVLNTEDNNTYLSKQDVPAGIEISNPDYWYVISFGSAQNIRDIIGYDTVEEMTHASLNVGEYVMCCGYHNINDRAFNLYRIVESEPLGVYVRLDNGLYAQLITKNNLTFHTLNELKSTNVSVGDICYTSGYYNVNDGGGSIYIITDNSTKYHETLDNGLHAELISDKSNILCYGAVINGESSDAIKNALENNNNYIVIPPHSFVVGNTIKLTNGCTIRGCGKESILKSDNNILSLSGVAEQHYTISDLTMLGTNEFNSVGIRLGEDGTCINTLIENCYFDHMNRSIVLNGETDILTIRNNHFIWGQNIDIDGSDVTTNKSGIRIYDNHFQQAKTGSVNIYMNGGSNLSIYDNLFQNGAYFNSITHVKINDYNVCNISGNYFEMNHTTIINNYCIEANNCSGLVIESNRAQGFYKSIVKIDSVFSVKIGIIIYSGIGHNIEYLVENNTPDYSSHRIFDEYVNPLNAHEKYSSYNNLFTNVSGLLVKTGEIEIFGEGLSSTILLSDIYGVDTIHISINSINDATRYGDVIIDINHNLTYTINDYLTLEYDAEVKRITITEISDAFVVANYKIFTF